MERPRHISPLETAYADGISPPPALFYGPSRHEDMDDAETNRTAEDREVGQGAAEDLDIE